MGIADWLCAEGRFHYNEDDLFLRDIAYTVDTRFIPPTIVNYNVVEQVTNEITKEVVLNRDEIMEIIEEMLPERLSNLKNEVTAYVLGSINNNMVENIRVTVAEAINEISSISSEEIDEITQ